MKKIIITIFLFAAIVFAGCDPNIDTGGGVDSGDSDGTSVSELSSAADKLEISFSAGDSIDSVTGNITLPTSVGDVTVSWASSNSDVIAADGTVVPSYISETVTLTATLSDGSSTTTKTFTLTVPAAAVGGDSGCTVYFYSNGGSDVSTLWDVEDGALISKPADPVKAGYIFAGWYKEETFNTLWDFAADTVSGDTVELYAGWLAAPAAGSYIHTNLDDQAGYREIASSQDGTRIAAVDSFGLIYTSTDSGATLTENDFGQSGDTLYLTPVEIASNSDGNTLVVAATANKINGEETYHHGSIWRSADQGGSWSRISGDIEIEGVVLSEIQSSSDGTKLAVIGNGDPNAPDNNHLVAGYLYVSSDSGTSWSYIDFPYTVDGGHFRKMAMSDDGAYLYILGSGPNGSGSNWYLYTTTDMGTTWTRTQVKNSGGSSCLSTDGDGSLILLGGSYDSTDGNDTNALISTDYGENWITVDPSDNESYYRDVAVSSDGGLLLMNMFPYNPGMSSNNGIYISKDEGGSWTLLGDTEGYYPIAATADKTLFYSAAGSGLWKVDEVQ